jgi:hypothetical protein
MLENPKKIIKSVIIYRDDHSPIIILPENEIKEIQEFIGLAVSPETRLHLLAKGSKLDS